MWFCRLVLAIYVNCFRVSCWCLFCRTSWILILEIQKVVDYWRSCSDLLRWREVEKLMIRFTEIERGWKVDQIYWGWEKVRSWSDLLRFRRSLEFLEQQEAQKDSQWMIWELLVRASECCCAVIGWLIANRIAVEIAAFWQLIIVFIDWL